MLDYHAAKAAGLCVRCGEPQPEAQHAYCVACRALRRAAAAPQDFAAREDARAHRAALAARLPPEDQWDGIPRLACCGQWWPMTTMPFSTPCCGRSIALQGQHVQGVALTEKIDSR